ncbi:hypothetical protein B0H16DRAFT_1861813 [Mycena metata]|uniref:Uncharacterized protein n=1 Tax=Mycena metata TaxID=1033252 RepID=A0AAD7N1L1_9AGAR|nr:hypothetical protein B0H16DRAFT_1861813 [Mycena metata]
MVESKWRATSQRGSCTAFRWPLPTTTSTSTSPTPGRKRRRRPRQRRCHALGAPYTLRVVFQKTPPSCSQTPARKHRLANTAATLANDILASVKTFWRTSSTLLDQQHALRTPNVPLPSSSYQFFESLIASPPRIWLRLTPPPRHRSLARSSMTDLSCPTPPARMPAALAMLPSSFGGPSRRPSTPPLSVHADVGNSNTAAGNTVPPQRAAIYRRMRTPTQYPCSACVRRLRRGPADAVQLPSAHLPADSVRALSSLPPLLPCSPPNPPLPPLLECNKAAAPQPAPSHEPLPADSPRSLLPFLPLSPSARRLAHAQRASPHRIARAPYPRTPFDSRPRPSHATASHAPRTRAAARTHEARMTGLHNTLQPHAPCLRRAHPLSRNAAPSRASCARFVRTTHRDTHARTSPTPRVPALDLRNLCRNLRAQGVHARAPYLSTTTSVRSTRLASPPSHRACNAQLLCQRRICADKPPALASNDTSGALRAAAAHSNCNACVTGIESPRAVAWFSLPRTPHPSTSDARACTSASHPHARHRRLDLTPARWHVTLAAVVPSGGACACAFARPSQPHTRRIHTRAPPPCTTSTPARVAESRAALDSGGGGGVLHLHTRMRMRRAFESPRRLCLYPRPHLHYLIVPVPCLNVHARPAGAKLDVCARARRVPALGLISLSPTLPHPFPHRSAPSRTHAVPARTIESSANGTRTRTRRLISLILLVTHAPPSLSAFQGAARAPNNTAHLTPAIRVLRLRAPLAPAAPAFALTLVSVLDAAAAVARALRTAPAPIFPPQTPDSSLNIAQLAQSPHSDAFDVPEPLALDAVPSKALPGSEHLYPAGAGKRGIRRRPGSQRAPPLNARPSSSPAPDPQTQTHSRPAYPASLASVNSYTSQSSTSKRNSTSSISARRNSKPRDSTGAARAPGSRTTSHLRAVHPAVFVPLASAAAHCAPSPPHAPPHAPPRAHQLMRTPQMALVVPDARRLTPLGDFARREPARASSLRVRFVCAPLRRTASHIPVSTALPMPTRRALSSRLYLSTNHLDSHIAPQVRLPRTPPPRTSTSRTHLHCVRRWTAPSDLSGS